MERTWMLIGIVACFTAVAAGAFGAHALRARIEPDLLTTFEVGVRYQFYHGLALFAVAWGATRWPGTLNTSAGIAFAIGILIFSGSLYTLALTGVRWLGAITPIGGLSFLLGWIFLALSLRR